MKVTVSVPDPVFRSIDRTAKRLGISRSELMSRAAAAFVEDHRGREVTESYNRAYGSADPASPPDTDGDELRQAAARRLLLDVEW
jgi:Ribbon-helix-helix protein, copG family